LKTPIKSKDNATEDGQIAMHRADFDALLERMEQLLSKKSRQQPKRRQV